MKIKNLEILNFIEMDIFKGERWLVTVLNNWDQKP